MENKAAQMDKVYNPQAIEGELYKEWEETGAFVAHREEGKKPFTIVMPPPNITGQLHMGHALDGDASGQPDALSPHEGRPDALAAGHGSRVHRHGSEDRRSHAQGRAGPSTTWAARSSCARAWAWKNEYGGRIVRQHTQAWATACDWSRERFTMDEGCSKAVHGGFHTTCMKRV